MLEKRRPKWGARGWGRRKKEEELFLLAEAIRCPVIHEVPEVFCGFFFLPVF